jgi:hypothetical protein
LATFHEHVTQPSFPYHVPCIVDQHGKVLEWSPGEEFDIWHGSAKFTLQHYTDKGFKGGHFQAFGQRINRCNILDYTPETLPEVVQRFLAWALPGQTPKRVVLDGNELSWKELLLPWTASTDSMAGGESQPDEAQQISTMSSLSASVKSGQEGNVDGL